VALIRRRGLRAGARLPAVRQLAEELSVTIPTLRESLRRLQAIGMVDIRHGSGIYVRTDEPRVLLANPYPGALEARTILELLDARILIEPWLASLAAQHADESALEELESILDRAGDSLDDDDALHGHNVEFHTGIARLSGNVILAQVIESMLELHGPEQLAVLRLYNDRRRDLGEHQEIRAALARRDASGAAEVMRRHLTGVRVVMEARLEAASVRH
jgi:GntR family transcriptional repressor for pyruvate dehydrogenase complex